MTNQLDSKRDIAHALAQLHQEMGECRQCETAGFPVVPGAVMSGVTTANFLLIGQAPGVTEVEAKRPFNAGSGQRLFQWLTQAGFEESTFRATQYMSSVTKCFPGKSPFGKGDRVPSRTEQALCRPFLVQEIKLVNPQVIILVGGLAIKLLYPAKRRLDQIIGKTVYFSGEVLAQELLGLTWQLAEELPAFDPTKSNGGRWVVPLPHPSGASLWHNNAGNQALIQQAIKILAEMRQAFMSTEVG